MNKNIIYIIYFFLLVNINALAGKKDIDEPVTNYIISGNVIDEATKKPLEYATVKLLKLPDSTLVTGSISGVDGAFELNAKTGGKFLVEIHFLGYDIFTKAVELTKENNKIKLGEIKIHPDSENIDEVVVKGNKYAMDYQIDKKILHVSKQFSSVSGTAVDVLQNAPSVKVDIEGNVSLRGNSNFTVLIDDRPTVLDATEALEQIPAGMIQDIEIITNPSAKYDPEGTAGIINIITKKRSINGFSGLANLNVGLDDKYGGDILLNYRNEHFNVFVGADYNSRNYPGSMEFEQRTTQIGTDYFLNSEGDRSRQRERYSIRSGFEWFISDKTNFNLSGRYGDRESSSESFTDYSEWNSGETEKINYNSLETGTRGGYFYSISSAFTHKFKPRFHQLDASFMLYNRQGDELNVNTLYNSDGSPASSQRSTESGPGTGIRYRLNYQQKFTEALMLETGWEGRLGDSEESNGIYDFNTGTEEYEFQDIFSHDVNYNRNIQAAYALFSGQLSNLGYQVGLRTEYTYRKVDLEDTGESFDIDRWDYFPGVHLSYKLSQKDQFLGSYTRRIDRPRGWNLEPFITWSDAYNVRQGNPDLQPEYIDSYEIAYQKQFGQNAFTIEAYYRTTENKIERIRSVYRDNIIMQSFENVGKDYSLGTELILNIQATKFWETDLTGNFYQYRVEGVLDDKDFSNESFTWGVRWNNTFKLKENISMQLNPAYSGPEVEAQEIEEGYFRLDAAVMMSFMEKKLKATLQVRDVFGTSQHESTLDLADFYSHRIYRHKSPMVMLNLSWRINNYKPSKKGGRNGGVDDPGADEGEM